MLKYVYFLLDDMFEGVMSVGQKLQHALLLHTYGEIREDSKITKFQARVFDSRNLPKQRM
jgi:hypothetical protein